MNSRNLIVICVCIATIATVVFGSSLVFDKKNNFTLLSSLDMTGQVLSIDIDKYNNVAVGTRTGNHNGALYFLDSAGKQIWQKQVDRIIGSVVISDNSNFIAMYGYELGDSGARVYHNNQLIVFDKAGNELWRYPPKNNIVSEEKDFSFYTMATSKDGLYHFIGVGNKTTFFDSGGNEIWETVISGDSRTSKIADSKNYILIATQNHQDKIDYDWGLTLLDNEGNIIWQKSGIDGQTISEDAISISSMDNLVSIGVAPRGDEGVLYVFDKSGEMKWKEITPSVIRFTAFTDDEKNLVIATNNGLRFYDVEGNFLWSEAIVFKPEISSKYVIGRSPYENQDLLRVFDYTGNEVFKYAVDSPIRSIQISNDSKLLVMGTKGESNNGPGKLYYFTED